MKDHITPNLLKLARLFKKKGELYIVGGYVRNALLGIYETDIDLASKLTNDEVKEVVKMNQKEMELIVVICEKGHTDDVMDAARSAGAGGGTVIHAKGTGSKYTDKFFGVSIADEKEMIYIVSPSEKKKDIMTAIMEQAGPTTKSHAITFSLPVSDTAGLRIFEAEK